MKRFLTLMALLCLVPAIAAACGGEYYPLDLCGDHPGDVDEAAVIFYLNELTAPVSVPFTPGMVALPGYYQIEGDTLTLLVKATVTPAGGVISGPFFLELTWDSSAGAFISYQSVGGNMLKIYAISFKDGKPVYFDGYLYGQPDATPFFSWAGWKLVYDTNAPAGILEKENSQRMLK